MSCLWREQRRCAAAVYLGTEAVGSACGRSDTAHKGSEQAALLLQVRNRACLAK